MNCYFISGPHGAGKTTLVHTLGRMDKIVPVDIDLGLDKEGLPEFTRQKIKILERVVENVQVREIALKNPDKIFIGNRTIYDDLAYSNAHLDMGWINLSQWQQLTGFINGAYAPSLGPIKAIVYNPPFETVAKRLLTRNHEVEADIRKQNLDFLRAACRGFECFKSFDSNILYLTEDEPPVDKILEFIGYKDKK